MTLERRLSQYVATLVTAALALGACGGPLPVSPSSGAPSAAPGPIVLDDFESGDLADWQVIDSGTGHWFVYEDGAFSPDPLHAAVMARFRVPDPPHGTHALTSDSIGPGTHVLYRDIRLDGRLSLRAWTYYVTNGDPFSEPANLSHDAPAPVQQFRIDVMDPAAPIDSVADGDVLVNLFRTGPQNLSRLAPAEVSEDLSPWAGRAVRIRIAKVDNRGPLRAGVDDLHFVAIEANAGASVASLDTPKAVTSRDLVLARLSEADAVAALSATTQGRADAGVFSGAVLVARHGKVLLQGAWGDADRDAHIPNSPDTRFRLASMNKMFTAVATLQLVEAGALALDQPIGTYLPGYRNAEVASKVTVRHLLGHTAGTGDIFGTLFERHRLDLRDHDDYIELFGDSGLAFEPGSRWAYSNYGYVLLGALIEAASGESYYDYVREHVFKPVGMTRTDSLPESAKVPDRATGYTRSTPEAAWVANTDTLPWRGTAAGGGYSTVGDLFRFAEGLTSGKLISKASLAEATRAQTIEPYGLGFELHGEGNLRSFGHGGAAPGMNGDLRIFPELGFVVVALSNLDPQAATEVVESFQLRMPDR